MDKKQEQVHPDSIVRKDIVKINKVMIWLPGILFLLLVILTFFFEISVAEIYRELVFLGIVIMLFAFSMTDKEKGLTELYNKVFASHQISEMKMKEYLDSLDVKISILLYFISIMLFVYIGVFVNSIIF